MLDPNSFVCVECGQPFDLTAGEREWYQKRMEENPQFKLPKRCKSCLEKKKEKTPPPKKSSPSLSGRSAPREGLRQVEEGEIRIVLATVDFEDLVSGRAVFWKPEKIRVVLADIGFDAMRKAIDRAEKELNAAS